MIIDAHTHIFPDRIAPAAVAKLSAASHVKPHTLATAGDLVRSEKEAGIDLGIVLPVATSPEQVVKVNDRSARINREYDGQGLFSLGAMHPDFEGWHDELKRIKDLGLRGIKLHPVYQGVDIDDIRFLRILDRAAELDLVVVTHAGADIGVPGDHCTTKMCRNAARTIGPFRFVLAHMGGWRSWEEVPDQLADTGVYLDTSFSGPSYDPTDDGFWTKEDSMMLSSEEMTGLIRAVGADRVLFGTDSPWTDQAKTLSFIKELPLTAEEKAKVLGANAARVFFSEELEGA